MDYSIFILKALRHVIQLLSSLSQEMQMYPADMLDWPTVSDKMMCFNLYINVYIWLKPYIEMGEGTRHHNTENAQYNASRNAPPIVHFYEP